MKIISFLSEYKCDKDIVVRIKGVSKVNDRLIKIIVRFVKTNIN